MKNATDRFGLGFTLFSILFLSFDVTWLVAIFFDSQGVDGPLHGVFLVGVYCLIGAAASSCGAVALARRERWPLAAMVGASGPWMLLAALMLLGALASPR